MASAYRLKRPSLAYPPEAEKPAVPLLACPVKASMGVVSRKWTLMIVRDIAFYKLSRYGEFLKNNPGLTERVLSRRLAEMVREGLLVRVAEGDEVRYGLTEKGRDLGGVLLGFLAYGSKHHAAEVFADGRARTLAEAFPQFDAAYVARVLGAKP